MQFFISIILLLMTSNIYASMYHQVSCSDAKGATKISYDLLHNSLYATERTWDSGGLKNREIIFNLDDLKIEHSNEAIIDKESNTYCDENGDGWNEYTITSSKKSSVKLSNGGLFSKDIIGVTKDRSSIEVFIICEEYVNDKQPCFKM